METYILSTAKGKAKGTLAEVCEWQARHQGAYASVTLVDGREVEVDEIEFNLDDMDGTVRRVRRVIKEDGGEAMITAAEAAAEVVAQMSDDDRLEYQRAHWRCGVSSQLDGAWAHLDEDEVLDEIEARLVAE